MTHSTPASLRWENSGLLVVHRALSCSDFRVASVALVHTGRVAWEALSRPLTRRTIQNSQVRQAQLIEGKASYHAAGYNLAVVDETPTVSDYLILV